MKRSDVLTRLNEAVLSLTSSDSWQRWLKTRKAFHNYSFRNQVLLSVQTPSVTTAAGVRTPTAEHPTQVAGYRKWQELGRQVVKGADGLGILAPCKPSKKKLREAAENGDEVRMRFTGANVFDVSQTEPIEGKEIEIEPPGVWGDSIGDVDNDLAADVAIAAVDLGVSHVNWCGDPERGRASYSLHSKAIEVDGDLDPAPAIHGVVHELAHHVDMAVLGAYNDALELAVSRAGRELIADSAAWLVCDSLGIDSDADSVFYVAHWTKDLEDPAAALSAVAGRVLEVATAIEDALAHVRSPDPDVPAATAVAA